MPRDPYELIATQDNGMAWTSRHPSHAAALAEAEKYRATPGSPQVWGVAIRDRRQPTGDAEVANQTVVFEAQAEPVSDPWTTRHNVVSLTDNGSGVLRVTTETDHFLTSGTVVSVTLDPGASESYQGGVASLATVVDATRFDAINSAYYGPGTGRWD